MKRLMLLLSVTAILTSCAGCDLIDDRGNREGRLPAGMPATDERLSRAELRQLIRKWIRESPPIKDADLENDTLRAVYAVYREFFRPRDLTSLGDWEWGNALGEGSEFVAVQESIAYEIESSDDSIRVRTDGTRATRRATRFRPTTQLPVGQILYLTPEREAWLRRYLGDESTKLGEGNVMSPSRASGESRERYNDLRPLLPVLHGHWGGTWHLASFPHVELVTLNRDLTHADITFRVGYQGGEARLKRNGDEWTVVESEATWIE